MFKSLPSLQKSDYKSAPTRSKQRERVANSRRARYRSTNTTSNRFSNNYTDARFYKVDVDEVPEVAQEQSVRAMPTFLLFKDGKQVGEVVGANPVALEAAIKQHA
jgi:thiol-disulfide isomerase/thioredoxin